MTPSPKWLTSTPIAHRGLHDGNREVPENSREAFRLAIARGVPIEFDVQKLGDGTLVVFHDEDLNRLCGDDLALSSLAKEDLDQFRLNSTLETIPTLEEVLQLVDGQVPLLMELKNFGLNRKMERHLLKLLDDYKGAYALQSFNPLSIKWIKRRRPRWQVGQLVTSVRHRLPINYLANFALLNFWKNPDFISFDAQELPDQRVHYFKQKGVPILVWTVKSPKQLEAVSPYCDNIIFEGFDP